MQRLTSPVAMRTWSDDQPPAGPSTGDGADHGRAARRAPPSHRDRSPARRQGDRVGVRERAPVQSERRFRCVSASDRVRYRCHRGGRRRRAVRAHHGLDVPRRFRHPRRAGTAGRADGGRGAAGPLPGRDDRGGKAVQRRRAPCGALRGEGLPTARRHPQDGRRPRHGRRDRRGPNRARGGRPRPVEPQPPPHAAATSGRRVHSTGAARRCRRCTRQASGIRSGCAVSSSPVSRPNRSPGSSTSTWCIPSRCARSTMPRMRSSRWQPGSATCG